MAVFGMLPATAVTGHKQSIRHGARKQSVSAPMQQCVNRRAHASAADLQHMGVDHRGRDVGVAK